MDPLLSPISQPEYSDGRCSCGCHCCFSPSFRRSVKRKAEEHGHDAPPEDIARVDAENEMAALRETVSSQQEVIHELSVELEEERNAAASAASETMSMIRRLQHEKAEVQMESRQFRWFAEEKMDHDVREIAALEDLLFKRDQEIEVLYCEVSAYKHRILSLGFSVSSDPVSPNSYAGDSTKDDFDLSPEADYPPLRCEAAGCYDEGTPHIEMNTPPIHEQWFYELKTSPTTTRPNPCSSNGGSSFGPQESSANADRNTDVEDEEIDRVYTIDAIHGAETGTLTNQRLKEESCEKVECEGGDGEIKKLYKRLQALEADRETMRQAVFSMGLEKAQLELLRGITQQLCKDVKQERRIVKKKPPWFAGFSFLSLIKWAMALLFWRKNSSRSRYAFGLSHCNSGLLQILEKSPQLDLWRCLTRTTTRKL